MPRFHFHLRNHGAIHRDPDGTELPDVAAARAHAAAVAEELMHCSDGRTRHWSMSVESDDAQPGFDVFFADVDPSLAGYSPQMRMLVSETCRRIGGLTDALCAARATRMETRILLARARGRPHLVCARGE